MASKRQDLWSLSNALQCRHITSTFTLLNCSAIWFSRMSFFFRLGDVVSVPIPPAEEMRYVVKCATSMKFEKSSKKNGLSPVKSTSTAVFNAFALARFGHKSGTVEAINKVKLGAFLKVCCRITNKRVIVKVISLLYCSIYVFLWYFENFYLYRKNLQVKNL